MATQSIFLPGESPWTEEPGGLQGMGRSPGERNGKPHHYSCLKTPTDRGAWWATLHGVAKS